MAFSHIPPISAEKGTNVEKIREWAKDLLPENIALLPGRLRDRPLLPLHGLRDHPREADALHR